MRSNGKMSMIEDGESMIKKMLSWSAFARPICWGVGLCIFTFGTTLLLPDRYSSESKILPAADGKSAGLGNLASAAAAFGVALPGGDGGDANFVDILNSRTIRERLLGSEFVYGDKTWHFGMSVARKSYLYQYIAEKNVDRALLELSRMIIVSRDLKTKVVTIRVETKSAELSQSIARRMVALLEEFVQERGRTKGGAKALFAQARLNDAQKELVNVEDKFRGFLGANRNYLTSTDPSVRLLGMRMELDLKLHQQLVSTLVLSREQALMDEKNDIPVLNVLEWGNLPCEKNWPPRGLISLFVGSLSFVSAWMVGNRKALKSLMVDPVGNSLEKGGSI